MAKLFLYRHEMAEYNLKGGKIKLIVGVRVCERPEEWSEELIVLWRFIGGVMRF